MRVWQIVDAVVNLVSESLFHVKPQYIKTWLVKTTKIKIDL